MSVRLPEHKAGLTLQHNDHLNVYQTAARWIADDDSNDWSHTWASPEAKARAAATNEVWTLHWYPETPIGFLAVAAPTLDELLRLALSAESADRTVATTVAAPEPSGRELCPSCGRDLSPERCAMCCVDLA